MRGELGRFRSPSRKGYSIPLSQLMKKLKSFQQE